MMDFDPNMCGLVPKTLFFLKAYNINLGWRGLYNILSLNTILDCIAVSKFKYRDRATIVGDILGTINSDPRGKTKTSIMRGANLNHDQVNRYLDFLVLCDAVKAATPLRSQELARYRLTQRGLRFLKTTDIWDLMLDMTKGKPV